MTTKRLSKQKFNIYDLFIIFIFLSVHLWNEIVSFLFTETSEIKMCYKHKMMLFKNNDNYNKIFSYFYLNETGNLLESINKNYSMGKKINDSLVNLSSKLGFIFDINEQDKEYSGLLPDQYKIDQNLANVNLYDDSEPNLTKLNSLYSEKLISIIKNGDIKKYLTICHMLLEQITKK